MRPGDMLDNRNLDGCEILISEPTLLRFRPRYCALIEFEGMLSEFDFLRPQEVVGVEFEIVEALLSKTFAWSEFGRMSRQRRKREKGVFRDAADGAIFFRKGGGNGSDFLVDALVLEDESFRVCWRERCERLLRDDWCERGR